MPKPAGFRRKPKPEVMPRCCRLVWVLSNRNQPKATTATTARIWKIQARAWGSVSREPRRCEEEVTGMGALSRWPPAEHGRRRGHRHPPGDGRRSGRSAHRRRVLHAPLVPQGVEPPLDLQLTAGAHVAIEDFRVVAHLLDDPHRPVAWQLQVLAVFALGAQQPG